MAKAESDLPIYVSWIGTTDINCMESWRLTEGLDTPPENSSRLTIPFKEEPGQNGPIRTFTDNNKFSQIYLLASKEYDFLGSQMKDWIKRGNNSKCQIISTSVEDPTSYDEVYKALDKFFSKYWTAETASRYVFNLTPGTPAMQAMLFYMSQIRYSGGKTFRTVPRKFAKNNKQILEVNAPFSLKPDLYLNTQTQCPQSDEIEKVIELYAPVKAINILLLGESGVGKSSAAQKIHYRCGGKKDNFIIANCAELAAGDANMFRAELFGAKKGSFTGCTEDKTGLFELAQNGTIFLDEVAEIPLSSQSVLLRALQDKEIMSIGSKKVVRLNNVRVISATNHNLLEDVKNGKFREDLYYRLAMCSITLQNLREICFTNREYFQELVQTILNDLKKEDTKLNDTEFKLTKDAWDCLMSYQWPGNIRQLRHVLLLSTVYALNTGKSEIDGKIISLHLSNVNTVSSGTSPADDFIPNDLNQWLAEQKDRIIRNALRLTGDNTSKAAKMLGMNEQTLYSYLKKAR